MPRSRRLMLIGVICLLIGLMITSTNTSDDESADSSSDTRGEQSDIASTATVSPTVSPIPPTATVQSTATVTPVPTPQLDGQLVWQDAFDNTASGWEPMYVAPVDDRSPVNRTAFNGYMNGNYRFMVNKQTGLLWDFNTAQPLPGYPYAVEADIQASHDHMGALILDYRGDVGNIDNGDGIFVRFHVGEAPTTPHQVWSLLGIDQGSKKIFDSLDVPFTANLYALEMFESSNGQRYRLACDQYVMPLLTRTATLRVEVDASFAHATLIDATNPANVVSMTCKRIAASGTATSGPALMGVLGIYTPRLVPIQSDYVLDFQDLRILEIDAVNQSGNAITDKPFYLLDSDCNTEFNTGMRKRLVEYNDDGVFCGALGDWGIWDIQIVRYEQQAEQLLGRWQCGSDPEGVIELTKQDWRMVIRLADQQTFYLYSVESTPFTGDQTHLIMWDDLIQPGDRMSSLSKYFFAYKDADMVASWLGKCTRLP